MVEDKRYGMKGRAIWILAIGPIIWIGMLFFLFYILLTENFSDAISAFVVLTIVVLALIYFLVANIQVLIEAPHVVQSMICESNRINIRFYFGREMIISLTDIKEICDYMPRKWLTISTLLDRKKNYRIILKNKDKLYLIGSLDNVDKIINYLKESRAQSF